MFSSIFISRFMALDQSEASILGHCGWFNMGKIGLRSLVITSCPYTTNAIHEILCYLVNT